jgi:hypothetical protein
LSLIPVAVEWLHDWRAECQGEQWLTTADTQTVVSPVNV